MQCHLGSCCTVTIATDQLYPTSDTCGPQSTRVYTHRHNTYTCTCVYTHRHNTYTCTCVYTHRHNTYTCTCVYTHRHNTYTCTRVYTHRHNTYTCTRVYTHRHNTYTCTRVCTHRHNTYTCTCVSHICRQALAMKESVLQHTCNRVKQLTSLHRPPHHAQDHGSMYWTNPLVPSHNTSLLCTLQTGCAAVQSQFMEKCVSTD